MRTSWNLELLYKSEKDPAIKKDIEKSVELVGSFCKKWRENDEYVKNPTTLKEALDDYEELHSKNAFCEKPLYYLSLMNSLDQSNTQIKGRINKLRETAIKLHNNIRFFGLKISKIKPAKRQNLIHSPLLKEYKHYLEHLFRFSKYRLSEKEENVFTLMSKPSSGNWASMLEELLSKQELRVLTEQKDKFEKIPYNEIKKYLNSKDKEVRDYAAKEFNKTNSKYAEIAEFEVNSILEAKKIKHEYKGVPRADLMRHISDDIDSEVVDTLLEVVTDNFDISQEYYKLKAQLLKQRVLGYHERNVPLGKIDTNYTYDDSINLIDKAFKNIDPDFAKIVENLSKEGQYDVFPKKNKSGGAFCISRGKVLPTYILLNHNGKLNDVLTIAHESGHAIHSEMSKNQNALNCGYPTSLAEVASTFFEDFVLEEALKGADGKVKFSILAQKLNSDISSIFRQVAFYNFERELHHNFRNNGYLSRDEISKNFCNHMSSYLGDSIENDIGMQNGWVYWSHLRMFFYVYSYASGLLISKALQSMVKEDKKNVKLVKEFLKAGSTKSPKELFKGMGIDISKKDIWTRGIKSIKEDLETFKQMKPADYL